MNCQEAHERWHRRFDEGSPDALLDEHLAGCKTCGAYAAQMQTVTRALDVLRNQTDDVSLADAPRTARSTLIRLCRPLAAAAVIAMAVVLYRASETEPPKRAPVATVQSPVSEAPLGVTLQGESKDRLVLVASATGDPAVTLFRLYPRLAAIDERK